MTSEPIPGLSAKEAAVILDVTSRYVDRLVSDGERGVTTKTIKRDEHPEWKGTNVPFETDDDDIGKAALGPAAVVRVDTSRPDQRHASRTASSNSRSVTMPRPLLG